MLSQINPEAAAEGLAKNPLAWGLVLALLALAYLFRELRAAQTAQLEAERASNKEMREILESVIPLTTNLTKGIELLDRVTDRLTGKATQ